MRKFLQKKSLMNVVYMSVVMCVIVCCMSLFGTSRSKNVYAYTETIVSDKVIEISDYSAPLYTVTSGSKLVLNNVTISGDNASAMDKLIVVADGGCLELNGVIISGVVSQYGIYSSGVVIANNLSIDESVVSDIYINSNEESPLTLGKVSIDNINLQAGHIELNGNTRISKVIDLTLGSAKESVGSLIVKGNETFAGYYLDKFNYVGNATHTTSESVTLDCYLDYVGCTDYIVCTCTGDTCGASCKKKIAEDNLASKNLATGDIVFTTLGSPYKEGGVTYYFSQYGTAKTYLDKQSGDFYYSIDSDNYDSYKEPYKTQKVILDNYKYIGLETDKLYKIENTYVVKPIATKSISASVVTKENGEISTEENIVLHAGEDKLIFIEKPELQESYSIEVSSNIDYDILVDNNSLIALLLHTSKTESVLTATISADFEYETTKDVVVEMESDFTYTGLDLKDDLNPYYVKDESNVELEYEIYFGGEKVDSFKDAGHYVIKFINVPSDVNLDKTEIEVDIKQKELTITYFNYANLVYDNTAKIVTASLSGVCGEDTVNLTLENAENIYAGNYVITATIDNENYKIKSGDETLNYIIDKATVNMTNVEFNDETREYSDNNELISVTNLPSVVSVDYVCEDSIFLVGEYLITAEFTLEDTKNYYPLEVNSMTATLTIIHKEIDISKVKFEDKTYTYSGDEKSLEVTDIPSGYESIIHIDYSPKNCIDADTYLITAVLSVDETKYKLSGTSTLQATLKIEPADIDMTGVVFESKADYYDKAVKSLAVSGELPEFVTIDKYTNNDKVDAGIYTVVVSFKCSNSNYNTPSDMTATLTINKRVLSIEIKPYDFTYDGSAKTIEFNVGNTCQGDTVNITTLNTSNVDAGTYISTVTGVDNSNYILPSVTQFSYTIDKAVIDMTGVVLQDVEKEYNGTTFTPALTGELPNGVTANFAHDNICDVGEYDIVVSFNVSSNYVTPANMTAKVIITPKPIIVNFSNYTGLVADGTIKSIGITLAGIVTGESEEYEVAYSSMPIEAGNYTCTVTLKNGSNYIISNTNTVAFEILAKSLTYTQGDYVLTVTTDGISKTTQMSMEKNTIGEHLTQSINAMYKEVCNLDAFTITIDSEDTEKFALKTDAINLNSKNKICLYRVNGEELEEVTCVVKDGIIYFDASNQDKFILVEVKEDSANVALIVILSIVGTLAVSGGATASVILLKKKKAKKVSVNSEEK